MQQTLHHRAVGYRHLAARRANQPNFPTDLGLHDPEHFQAALLNSAPNSAERQDAETDVSFDEILDRGHRLHLVGEIERYSLSFGLAFELVFEPSGAMLVANSQHDEL